MKAEAKVAVDTVACLGVSVHRFPTQIGSRKKIYFYSSWVLQILNSLFSGFCLWPGCFWFSPWLLCVVFLIASHEVSDKSFWKTEWVVSVVFLVIWHDDVINTHLPHLNKELRHFRHWCISIWYQKAFLITQIFKHLFIFTFNKHHKTCFNKKQFNCIIAFDQMSILFIIKPTL